MHLTTIDIPVLLAYVAFVIGIGCWLKDRKKTSEDYLLAGRSLPAWITGHGFVPDLAVEQK
jgi:solute:Na+ symporter, SSS family